MRLASLAKICAFTAAICAIAYVPAANARIDHGFPGPLLGPKAAKGVVVWSHGRSIWAEDSLSPTPPYLRALRSAGWDILRFDRMRDNDSLGSSSRRLARHAEQLKADGYKRIVLAGQSFGAFLSLMAADQTRDVNAVIATAPAAFGNFQDFYDSWRLNATQLYPVLKRIKSARVMLFFFHDDDFDPGGRAAPSRKILAARDLGYAVINQPEYFTGHLAASSGLFLRRFGSCITDFAADKGLKGPFECHPVWGDEPSAQLSLPPELQGLLPSGHPAVAVGEGSGGPPAHKVRDAWYGFYPNGREVLLAIEGVHGDDLNAVYAIGPGIKKDEPAAWVRRKGRIVGDTFLFVGKHGESTLSFLPRPDGSLGAVWVSPNGKDRMHASLRRLDPMRFAHTAAAE